MISVNYIWWKIICCRRDALQFPGSQLNQLDHSLPFLLFRLLVLHLLVVMFICKAVPSTFSIVCISFRSSTWCNAGVQWKAGTACYCLPLPVTSNCPFTGRGRQFICYKNSLEMADLNLIHSSLSPVSGLANFDRDRTILQLFMTLILLTLLRLFIRGLLCSQATAAPTFSSVKLRLSFCGCTARRLYLPSCIIEQRRQRFQEHRSDQQSNKYKNR